MTGITRHIPLDTLREWDLPYSREHVVHRETEDVGRRWMDVATCIFKAPDDGLHYRFSYDVGKTEYQEQRWDEDLPDPVVCTRVQLVQITVDRWVPVVADGENPDPATAAEPQDRYWLIWTDDRRELIGGVTGPGLSTPDDALHDATIDDFDYAHTKARSWVESVDESRFSAVTGDWDALSEAEKQALRPHAESGTAAPTEEA